MAAAAHRSTPASSVNRHPPQPQVSAPVLEFRCMFTHDIFKKSKKWHDGSLRFHTFNKRVMVYDDTKSLVGGLHYRQSEEFGEGLELKLDRPVLVQVEEPLGQTNTDLTPLLGRQRQDGSNQSSLPPQPPRAAVLRTNATTAQARPKSIRELLGASQGKLGRARLPTQSPFEQRQALTNIQPAAEPPAKKRKIGTGEENEPIALPTQAACTRPDLVPTTSITPKPAQSIGLIVDISSDDSLSTTKEPLPRKDVLVCEEEPRSPYARSPPLSKPAKQKDKERRILENSKKDAISKKQKRAAKNAARHQDTAAPAPNTPRHSIGDKDVELGTARLSAKQRKTFPETNCADDRPAQSAQPSGSVPALTSRPSSAASLQSHQRFASGPRSSLKFASQAPRPKLMYKALRTDTTKEPSDSSRTSTASMPVPSVLSINGEQPQIPNPGRQRRTDLLDTDSCFAASQISRGTAALQNHLSQNKAQTKEAPAVPEESPFHRSSQRPPPDDDAFDFCMDEVDVDQAPESPLFMPRTASQLSPLASQKLMVDKSRFSELSKGAPSQDFPFSMSISTQSLQRQLMPSSPQKPETADPRSGAPSSPDFLAAALPPQRPKCTNEVPDSRAANLSTSGDKVPDPPPLSAAAQPCVLSKVKGRLFRRVVSEQLSARTSTAGHLLGDKSTDIDFDEVADPPSSPSLIEMFENDTLEAPARLPRAASDLITLDTTVTDHHLVSSSPSAEKDSDQYLAEAEAAHSFLPQPAPAPVAQLPPILPTTAEAGPWTATEAFLLFDWWPPGKHKPDYGQGVQVTSRAIDMIEDSASTNMKAVANKKYGMFRSARLVSQR